MPSQYGPVAVNHQTGALEYAAETVTQSELDNHDTDTTAVHGITDTAALLVTGQTAIAGLGRAAVAGKQVVVQATAVGTEGLVVRQIASAVADAFRVESSAGAAQVVINAYGELLATNIFHTGGSGPYFAMSATTLAINNNSNVANVPVSVRGMAGQTGRLQEWQNSDWTMQAGIEVDGKLKFIAGNEQTTIGSAGAASALPATPTKYFKVKDSAGTTLIIPAYAAS